MDGRVEDDRCLHSMAASVAVALLGVETGVNLRHCTNLLGKREGKGGSESCNSEARHNDEKMGNSCDEIDEEVKITREVDLLLIDSSRQPCKDEEA